MCRGRRICENDFHLVAISKRPTPNVELSMLKSESEFDIGRWAFGVFCFQSLIAKGNVHVARGLDEFAIGRNQLKAIDGFGDRHVAHLIILITNH